MAGGESDFSTLNSHTVKSLDDLPTMSHAVVSGDEGGNSPALALFIAQQFRLLWPPNSWLMVRSQFRPHRHNQRQWRCLNLRFLYQSRPYVLEAFRHFLAAGTGLSQQGRPAFSFNRVVPSFISTFANPSMSASVSSPSVSSLQNDMTRDVADHSTVLLSPLVNQPFIVGPGFLPVPAKACRPDGGGQVHRPERFAGSESGAEKASASASVRWLSGVDFPAQKNSGDTSRALLRGWRPLQFFPSSWFLTSRTAGKISCSTSCWS